MVQAFWDVHRFIIDGVDTSSTTTSITGQTLLFEFLDNAGYDSGYLSIELELHFAVLEEYSINVREADGAVHEFACIDFLHDGRIYFMD